MTRRRRNHKTHEESRAVALEFIREVVRGRAEPSVTRHALARAAAARQSRTGVSAVVG
jgi:hypothetical protein